MKYGKPHIARYPPKPKLSTAVWSKTKDLPKLAKETVIKVWLFELALAITAIWTWRDHRREAAGRA